MELVSLAQHSAWLGAAERPEKPSYSKRTARPQPRYMPACGAENGASRLAAADPTPAATRPQFRANDPSVIPSSRASGSCAPSLVLRQAWVTSPGVVGGAEQPGYGAMTNRTKRVECDRLRVRPNRIRCRRGPRRHRGVGGDGGGGWS